MKFTIEYKTLKQMVTMVGRKFPGTTRPDEDLKISVQGACVFVSATCRAGVAVAIETVEGECLVPRKQFQQVLLTFEDEPVISIQVVKGILRVRDFTMPVAGFSETGTAPLRFDWFGPKPVGLT